MWDCESFQEDWGERNKKKESFSVYDHVQGGILLDRHSLSSFFPCVK